MISKKENAIFYRMVTGLGVVNKVLYSRAGLFESRLMLTQDKKLTKVLTFPVYNCFSLLMFWVV